MTRVFIWKNNSPQEWEEISFSAFSKARRNGCFTGRFFVETVKMFRDEDDRIIMECSRKDFEKYQQEDRHSRYLQEHEKSRSIFPASHVGDRGGTEEGYQDTDLFVDESVDTAEQAIHERLYQQHIHGICLFFLNLPFLGRAERNTGKVFGVQNVLRIVISGSNLFLCRIVRFCLHRNRFLQGFGNLHIVFFQV